MAGETTYADSYDTTAFKGHGGQVCVLDKSHEINTGELEVGDIVIFGKVPAGAVYLDGFIATDDLDSSGTPALDIIVGDDDDPDGFVASGTVGQAAGVTSFSGAYVTNKTTTSAEKSIQIKMNAAAATAAAGTVRVVLRYYTP